MASCYICGNSEPVMKVICSECADKSCASCRYSVYVECLDLMLCRNLGGMGGELRATDFCTKYKEKKNG